MLNADKIKKDFPILKNLLVYLDNAATSQKPYQVINAIKDYYERYNANVHRGVYKIAVEATEKYEEAHRVVAKFINAFPNEIIFTRNTTESINLVAYSLGLKLKKDDEVVVSLMEHHSNFVPWQQICKITGAKFKVIPIDEKGNLKDYEKFITKNTKIVSITHASNVLGTINPIKEIINLAHKNGAIAIIDGAQSVPHFSVDVKDLDCDFLAFSGHKMLAPMGIGVLYGKQEILKSMGPFNYGGDMIREVKLNETKFNDLPWKFEAGTPNVEAAIGLVEAVKYLEKLGMNNIYSHTQYLTKYALFRLKEIPNIKVYGPEKRNCLISFKLGRLHPHDASAFLDELNIAIRGGHMCAQPLVNSLGEIAVARVSFYIYNTKEDVDKFVDGLKKAKGAFKV
ncbi:cysteine desulfurase [Candidatus Woesearchaeota archaeon]|nr:cysteine desulfurase [Candidatus Woesearchaeota archaeon]